MEIPVQEEKPKLSTEVAETSSDIELLLTRALLMYADEQSQPEDLPEDQEQLEEPASIKTLSWHQVYKQLPIALQEQRPTEAAVPHEPTTKTVEIKFELPSLETLTQKVVELKGLLRKIPKKFALAGAGGAIVLLSLFVWYFNRPVSTAKNTSGSIQAPTLQRGTPAFSTVLPTGKTINQLGGWVRISPTNRSPVYAYVDHINGIQADVSEQPLPAQLQSDTPDQMYKLAQNFGADSKLSAGDTTFYIGTDASDAQSVILAKDNLLILMKSVQIVPNDQWITYINSLN